MRVFDVLTCHTCFAVMFDMQAMAASYEPALWQELTAVAATSSSISSSSSASTAVSSTRPGKRAVPGPPPKAQQLPQQQQPQQQQQAQVLQVAAMPLQVLVNTVLQQPGQQHAHSDSSQPEQHAQASSCRPSALRLAVKFRVNKKMLLADVLLAAPVPSQQLIQQLQQLQAYQEAAAALRGPSPVGQAAEAVLPWQQ